VKKEIAMLLRRWERARQGDGQLVLIVGEPGLGKSRLTRSTARNCLDFHGNRAKCWNTMPRSGPGAVMTVDESKKLKKGTRVYWRGDAADR
jgi:AAA ATPase domain